MSDSASSSLGALVPSEIGDGFGRLRDELSERLSGPARRATQLLTSALPNWERPSEFADLGDAFERAHGEVQRSVDAPTLVDVCRLLIAEHAICLPATLQQRRIPDDVLALYPETLRRLLSFLRNGHARNYYYPNEYFVKDLRLATGLMVPCGAQAVQLRSRIGRKSSLRLALKRPFSSHILRFLRYCELVPWFRIHIDVRCLKEFNEAGWNAGYRRIASLLRRHTEVLGMVGNSWFFDPRLEDVSPHLVYLRQRPMEGGAVLLRGGASELDIMWATVNSPNRRQLYEAGRYIPVSYTLIWPREHLLRWAMT